jgi:hypothetical protein
MADDTVGDVIGALAADQLQEERQLKDSLTQRAATIISTSGTLVTLLLGASALVTQNKSFTVSYSVLIDAAIAVALLIVAALVALVLNGGWRQGAIPVETLRSINFKGNWGEIDYDKVQEIHDARLDLITRFRTANKWRARLLMLALSLECVAVAFLTIGTLEILLRKH